MSVVLRLIKTNTGNNLMKKEPEVSELKTIISMSNCYTWKIPCIFLHSFNRYLLSVTNISCSILGPVDIAMNKTKKAPAHYRA